MGMAMDSVRSETDQEGNCYLDENSSLVAATMAAHPLAQAIAGGGVLGPPGGGQGAVAATAVDRAAVGNSTEVVVLGNGGGGGGGIALDTFALQESVNQLQEENVNQLHEDRKMRRRQVERTAARLSRVRI